MTDSQPSAEMPREIFACEDTIGEVGERCGNWMEAEPATSEMHPYTRTDLVAPLIEGVEVVMGRLDTMWADTPDAAVDIDALRTALATYRKATGGAGE